MLPIPGRDMFTIEPAAFLASDRPALQKELLTTHLDELGYTRAELCELLDIGEIELDEMLETKPTVQLRIVK